MKCPKCNGDVEMMVDVTLLIPAELESRLTKTNWRRKDVKLYAANWDGASCFCRDDKCRWRMTPQHHRRMSDENNQG